LARLSQVRLVLQTQRRQFEEQGAEGGGVACTVREELVEGQRLEQVCPSGIGSSSGLVGNSFGLSEDDGLDDKMDEEPWTVWRGKKGKVKNLRGVEIGEANATDCLYWAGNKILEHVELRDEGKNFNEATLLK
jgi:hypothetical protein